MFKILFNNSIMVDGKGPSEITGLIQGRLLYEKKYTYLDTSETSEETIQTSEHLEVKVFPTVNKTIFHA